MARYFKSIPGSTWTVAPRSTTGFGWTWEDSGVGADQGPVVFMADPVSHQSAEVKLVTFDVKKCRRAPSPTGETRVFYEMSIRNESDITASFGIEIVTFNDDRV